MRRPLLLLPRELDEFVLADHARELIEFGGGAAALPGRIPYGALLRLPPSPRAIAAARIAKTIRRQIPADWERPPVLIAYHAIQWPVVHELVSRGVVSEVWYCRWDRYESAQDAGAAGEQLAQWHAKLAKESTLTFAVSARLAEIEADAGREAIVVGLSADDFPDGPLEPGGRGARLIAESAALDAPVVDWSTPVAVSLGHLGYRTDWRLLHNICERLPDLQLLLIGNWYEDQAAGNEHFAWLRDSPQVVWLGPLDDEDAAHVIAQADVGIVPFAVNSFNDAGLPTRILKYARLGRPTIAPALAGVRTWPRAVTVAPDADGFASLLRTHAGDRQAPDLDLREWALEQTAARMNAPLHARLQNA